MSRWRFLSVAGALIMENTDMSCIELRLECYLPVSSSEEDLKHSS